MAVEERVIIKIDVDADITGDLLIVERRIKALEDRFKGLDRKSRDVERSTKRFDKSMLRMDRTTRKLTSSFLKFFKTLGKFSFIGMALEIGVLTAALIGARLAMASGRIIAQGYQFALRGVAAGVLAVASAASVAAAAMRQFSEAQLAPFVGGRAQAAQQLRSIRGPVGGLLGRGESSALTGQLAKQGLSPNQSGNALTQLYNISGGDTKNVSSLVTGLAGDGSGFGQALEGIGPQGADIAKQVEGLDKSEIIAQLTSGALTPEAFQGFADDMANTFVGSLKTEFFGLFNVFADLGANMVGPFQDAFRQMGVIVRTFILNTGPLIEKFGVDSFAPSLIGAMQKTADFLENIIKKNMPKLEGFGTRLTEMWNSTRNFFRDMADAMRPLEAGADVLLSMFGAIFGGFTGNGVLSGFNELLIANADIFQDFGQSVGDLVSALLTAGSGESLLSTVQSMTDIFKQVTTDLVPPLAKIADSIHELVFSALPPIISAMASILEVVAGIMSAVTSVTGSVPGGGGGLMNAGLLLGTMALSRGRVSRGGPGLAARAGNMGRFVNSGALGFTAGRGGMAFGAPSKGVGFGGAAVGGLMLGDAAMDSFNGDTGLGNVAQGAAGGGLAAGGLLAAGVLSGPVGWTVLAGVGIGAVITGGIAWWQKNKKSDNAREFGAALIEESIDTLADASGTTVPNTVAALDELLASEERLGEMAKEHNLDQETLTNTLREQRFILVTLQSTLEGQVNTNLETLSRLLGITAEEALNFANNIGLDLIPALTLAQQVGITAANTPDLHSRGRIIQAIGDSQFTKNANAMGARDTSIAFQQRIAESGSIADFSVSELEEFAMARSMEMQGDASVGGAGLTAAQADQEFIDLLRVMAREDGTIGAAALANDLEAGRDDILREENAILARLFGVELEDKVGQELHEFIELQQARLEIMEGIIEGGEIGRQPNDPRGPAPTVEQRLAGEIAAVAEIGTMISQNIETGAKVDLTFSGVLTEETMNVITALVEKNVVKAVADGLGSTMPTAVEGARAIASDFNTGGNGNQGPEAPLTSWQAFTAMEDD